MAIDAPIPAIPPVQLPPPGNVQPAVQAQAILTPEPPDRWAALKQIGWWKPIDSIILGLLGAHIVSAIFFMAFGRMTFNVAVIGLLQMLVLAVLWTVIVVYRCMDFVVQLRANIEMLPFDSARIAVGFIQGGKGQ